MAGIGETTAILRIWGDNLDPSEVTALLRCDPSESHTKGQQIGTAERPRAAKTGAWRLSSTKRIPGDLEDQIVDLLSKVTSDIEVWNTITSRYEVDIFCGLFMAESNEGLSLSAKTLELLGNRGISIGLDIYDPTLE